MPGKEGGRGDSRLRELFGDSKLCPGAAVKALVSTRDSFAGGGGHSGPLRSRTSQNCPTRIDKRSLTGLT